MNLEHGWIFIGFTFFKNGPLEHSACVLSTPMTSHRFQDRQDGEEDWHRISQWDPSFLKQHSAKYAV